MDEPFADQTPEEQIFPVRRLSPLLFRRLFGRSAPMSHLLLCLATAFFLTELMIAYTWHLNLMPFAVCVFGFLVLICFALSRSREASLRISQIITVIALIKVLAIFVGVTGGAQSPYVGALYLPVFLSCLYYGLRGGLASTAAVCIYLYLLALWEAAPASHLSIGAAVLKQCVVFMLVSLSAALFAERMRRTASAATRRATVQANIVKQVEWFTDTGVMLQSLDDLETILSVAMIRIEDLLPFDSAAIYLRDVDESVLTLAQSTGVSGRRVPLPGIPMYRLDALRDPLFESLFIPDMSANGASSLHNDFAAFDYSAQSVIVAPLKTFDDFFGVICVCSKTTNGFSRKDAKNLLQLAHHIVYPIQRVRLEAMAATDALTGLNNSRSFHRRLREEVVRAQRYGHPMSLVLIDIDYFKRVNDTLGHRAGDAILTQMGAILRRSSRGIDFAARYGGEELAIICPESTVADAFQLAERIRVTVADMAFSVPEGGTTRITVSAGVAMLTSAIDSDTSLIEAADQALYRAKYEGRNRVRPLAD